MPSLGYATGLTHSILTRLERLARDKHSSLFGLFGSEEEECFVA